MRRLTLLAAAALAAPLAAAALTAAASPAFGQAVGGLEAPSEGSGAEETGGRPGDDQLTCTQLNAETTSLTGELMRMSSEMQAAVAERMRSARAASSAAQGAAIASGLASAIPFVGGIVGSVVGQAARARAMSAATGGQAQMLALSERMMTRSAEISPRIERLESLRAARRCPGMGAGPGQVADADPAPAETPPG